ncbi:hypothetical protein Hypma_014418 [Hypsizygus marmoreus]|uniref:Uncharacterized protein n=1 Tax=Hypsizygus marmoreus TaxID=39966 RepID=A0A369JA63_HYPMA|nr:hypothetical protein Hypma_014418 [Hypsizygus marmoreus]
MLFERQSPEYKFILDLVPFFANASARLLEQVFLKQLGPIWFDRFPIPGPDSYEHYVDGTSSGEGITAVGKELRQLLRLGTVEAQGGWERALTVDADRERRRRLYRKAFNEGSPLPQGHQFEAVLEDFDRARAAAREAGEQELHQWAANMVRDLSISSGSSPTSVRKPRSSYTWVDVSDSEEDVEDEESIGDRLAHVSHMLDVLRALNYISC